MILETTSAPDHFSVRPAGFLGISAIPNLLDELLQALDSSPRLELDLSDVSGIDTAGIQLLMLLRKEASHLGKDVAYVHPSIEVREVFESVGRLDFLDDAVLVAGR